MTKEELEEKAEETVKELYKITNPLIRCKKIIEKIAELLAQIEKMKCCENCKYGEDTMYDGIKCNHSYGMKYNDSYTCLRNSSPYENKSDKWELAE